MLKEKWHKPLKTHQWKFFPQSLISDNQMAAEKKKEKDSAIIPSPLIVVWLLLNFYLTAHEIIPPFSFIFLCAISWYHISVFSTSHLLASSFCIKLACTLFQPFHLFLWKSLYLALSCVSRRDISSCAAVLTFSFFF